MRKLTILTIAIILSTLSITNAQNNIIDQVIAIVGNEPVLKSDIENEFINYQAKNMISGSKDFKAQIFENILIQKLLLAQAVRDSIIIAEATLESQLTSRVEQFIKQIGSKKKLEQYFKKSIMEIKDDFRDDVRNMMITEQMKNKISENVRVTPSEVRRFYKTLNKDSLPDIPAIYEIQQIVTKPLVTDAEKERIRKRLRKFRERIVNGENFSTLAVLYSEDKESASRGGELGYTARTSLVPEFANVAFNLKTDKVSKIVETEYGFHIIQLVDRKGERINVRHILLKPQIADKSRVDAKSRLDSIAKQLRNGKINFKDAAYYYSEDKKTKNNEGIVVNPQTGSSQLPLDILARLSSTTAQTITELKVGEISESFLDNVRGQEEYKIVKLTKIHEIHKANLNDDWAQFEKMLIAEKKNKLFTTWIKEKQKTTYIHIDNSYKSSTFQYKGWIK